MGSEPFLNCWHLAPIISPGSFWVSVCSGRVVFLWFFPAPAWYSLRAVFGEKDWVLTYFSFPCLWWVFLSPSSQELLCYRNFKSAIRWITIWVFFTIILLADSIPCRFIQVDSSIWPIFEQSHACFLTFSHRSHQGNSQGFISSFRLILYLRFFETVW